MNRPDSLLVIPCYRDGARLALFLPSLCAQLAEQLPGVSVQVVDDGSPVVEREQLTAFVENLRRRFDLLQPLVSCPTNRGKGHAIRTGWATAADVSWLAFVDADGAVPAKEVIALLGRARCAVHPALFIADRVQGELAQRVWFRHLGSRVYNFWVRLWLHLDLPDTQCGLKIVPAHFYRAQVWHEEHYAFDLELLLQARAADMPVIPQAIAWTEKPDSRLGLPAVFGLFVAAIRLRHHPGARAARSGCARH